MPQPNANLVTIQGSLLSTNALETNQLNANVIVANVYYYADGNTLTPVGTSYGNANVASFLPNYGGDILANNITGTLLTASQPVITEVGHLTDLTVVENITAQRDIIVTQSIDVLSGNINLFDAQNGNIFTAANIVAENQIFSGTHIDAVGNITGNYLIGNSGVKTYAVFTNNLLYANGAPWNFGNGGGGGNSTYSNADVAAYLPTDPTIISIEGNIATLQNAQYGNANVAAYLPTYSGNLNFVQNINTYGTLWANGNIRGTNFNTAGAVVAAGNISANYFIGNGALLTGIAVSSTYGNANVEAYLPTSPTILAIQSNVTNNASNITTLQSQVANITVLEYGNANVAVYLPTDPTIIALQANVANNASNITTLQSQVANITVLEYGNANVANYLPTYSGNLNPYNITATNTVTANLFIGNFQGNITGNLVVPGANGQVLYNKNGNAGADIGMTYNSVTESLTLLGNVTSAAFIGDGSQLTNITATANTGNFVFAADTLNLNNTNDMIIAPSNVLVGNVRIVLPGQDNIGIGDGISLRNYANTGINFINSDPTTFTGTTWSIQPGGDISFAAFATEQGNILTPTGTITAGYFVGNGSQLTGLPVAYGNADVSNYLASGTDTSNIITTANISGSYILGNGAFLTGISGGGGGNTNAILNGTSNVVIAAANGPITANISGAPAMTLLTTGIGIGLNSTGSAQRNIAIGVSAGSAVQDAIAIGYNAGTGVTGGTTQLAVGFQAGQTSQAYAVAVGAYTAQTGQGNRATAIGTSAGVNNQGNYATALGFQAGGFNQGFGALALGALAGNSNQPANSIVINGTGAEFSPQQQGFYVKPVRNDTGNVSNIVYFNTITNELTYAPATGGSSNSISNGTSSVSIPSSNGNISMAVSGVNVFNLSANIVAIGNSAGSGGQSASAIAMGYQAGAGGQGASAIAIGPNAGAANQISNSIAIGAGAGANELGFGAIAIGTSASGPGANTTIAIGYFAQQIGSNTDAIGIGTEAGSGGQGVAAIALGKSAGFHGQGTSAVAIGAYAGTDANPGNVQPANSIVINGTNNFLQAYNQGFYVSPVRYVVNGSIPSGFFNMAYNPTTGEIIYWS